MDLVTVLILGIATAINLIVIKFKYEKDRNADATLDLFVLVVLAWLFSNSITGLAVATLSSMFISAYLFLSPPNKLISKLTKRKKKRRRMRYN
jgi:hypothetical protein